MTRFLTVYQLLKWQAEQNPEAVAIQAPDRPALSYGNLFLQVETIIRSLNQIGITSKDRVAIVLPNGPELAVAFLGVAAGACSAPLNPAYRTREFDFYLSDLQAKAVITLLDFESPVREVAQSLGIPLLEFSVAPGGEAGVFQMADTKPSPNLIPKDSSPEDEALVLHTSGTTSKPKIVPLTHRNICTSAHNIKNTLQLTPEDCCLNIMPLFHIHGLMAAILSSLSAGAKVVCSPGIETGHFFEWLRVFQPTWYTAVPTMHQRILVEAQADRSLLEENSLRFIRSSSASLPPRVMEGLEEVFGAPVIESYGMTEAAHQMSSNPLPPRFRKPGSVGLAAGPKVAIMDEQGHLLSAGETGEIVIQGDNVTTGYENNPTANEEAFTNGWFRTGDQGFLDTEDYLTITGRIKEIINRGGEKIAPREVDEALLDHPEVEQAVAFAMPHPTLGEDLAAAVTLHSPSSTMEKDLRDFAFTRLADFKVPSQIAIVEEIPKGATGKLQRIGLAEKLTTELSADYIAPKSDLEAGLVKIWESVLKKEQVSTQDNFFALGGDSLLAASVLRQTEELVGQKLELPLLFQAPTIEQIASHLQGSHIESDTHLVPIRPEGSQEPLFLIPGHGGDIFTFTNLARYIQTEYPVYVYRFPEAARLDNTIANAELKAMAASCVNEIVTLQPEGPYQLGGFCYGGWLAFENAQQLHAMGKETKFVAIIYNYLEGSVHAPGMNERLSYHYESLVKGNFKERASHLKRAMARIWERSSRRIFPSLSRRFVPTSSHGTYFPLYYPGRIVLFDPIESSTGVNQDHYMGWKGLAAETEAHSIPGHYRDVFTEPNVRVLAEKLNVCLAYKT